MNELLASEVFGHLACCDEQTPYIVPLAYVFKNDILYGQTTEGKKISMLRKNPAVCFQVQREHESEWRSVLCYGLFEELDSKKINTLETVELVRVLNAHLADIQQRVGITVPFSFTDTVAPLSVDGRTSTLFRIRITEKTGRCYATEK